MSQSIAGLLEIGTGTGLGRYRAYLAAVQELDGATVDALATVEQALLTNPDERLNRPETLRLRGELRLKLGQTEVAEAGFREAITLARSIGAKAWELRATMSLASFLDTTDRRGDA